MSKSIHGPIVVGTDGCDLSTLAIAEAGKLARNSELAVALVYVRQIRLTAGISTFAIGALPPFQDLVNTEQTIAQAHGIALLDPPGIPWTFHVRCGQPPTELMKIARDYEADTIVVAGCRHGAFGSITHSSVAAQLLYRWPYSLLVVRSSRQVQPDETHEEGPPVNWEQGHLGNGA